MVDQAGPHTLDGGWWPYSRDLILEMGDLGRNFPGEHGPIISAVYSRTDWDTAPRVAAAGPRVIRMESSTSDDTRVVTLHTRAGGRLTLLVVPPSFTTGQGDEALLAAATPGNDHSAAEVLREVTNHHDSDPGIYWHRADGRAQERRDSRLSAPVPGGADVTT